MQLQQMLATRQVKPFQTEVQAKLDQLSSTSDTIEKWLKVQQAWVSLVQVFTTGDISKAMPTESKIFKGVNARWLKIMERAAEQKNVVQCC
jgi:dynein heavy chain